MVKRSCYQEVISRKRIIKDAHDLFDFGSEKLSIPLKMKEDTGTKREFVFVKKQDVNRSTRDQNTKTLPGTRTLHCAIST